MHTFQVAPDRINSERDYDIGGFIGGTEIYGLNFVASLVERVLILLHVYSYITCTLAMLLVIRILHFEAGLTKSIHDVPIYQRGGGGCSRANFLYFRRAKELNTWPG